MAGPLEPTYRHSTGLVDVLDRVLDKGLVVAGDIRVSLAEVELLTVRIRLLVCSIDKAEEIGLDWWRDDPHLSRAARRLASENEDLRDQVGLLEERLTSLEQASDRETAGSGSGKGSKKKTKSPSGNKQQKGR